MRTSMPLKTSTKQIISGWIHHRQDKVTSSCQYSRRNEAT
jgi:NADH:ubiquinone oxidoreductase subunit